jgi:hypothetical protein
MTRPTEVQGAGNSRSSAQPAGSVDFRQPASRLETPRPAPVALRVARLVRAAAVCPRHRRPAHLFALYRLHGHPDSSGARYRRGRALFHAFSRGSPDHCGHRHRAHARGAAAPADGASLLNHLRAVAGLSAVHSRLHGGPWRPRWLEQTCPHRNVGHRFGNSPPACATGGCNRRND